MRALFPRTSYARLGTPAARAVFVSFLGAAAGFAALAASPLGMTMVGKGRGGDGDLALYMAEVRRIHQGQGYYAAAAAELAPRGYPTRSVFNWRTPLPMWLLGKLPDAGLGRALLGLLMAAALVMGFEALAREQGHGLGRPLVCALAMTGPLLFCVLDGLYVSPVLWAGTWIALSVGAYGLGRPRLGAGFGLAALFFRELALPYCVAAAALAWWEGRGRELRIWIAGLAGWCLFFGLHWLAVQPWIGPDATAHEAGWIQFNGSAFVIATTQMNAYLLLLPQWITALYFSLAMLGFAGWDTPLGRRVGLSTCLYVVAFAVVGQPFNQYWGATVAPLWCFGAAQAPGAMRDLLGASGWWARTARPRRASAAAGRA